MKIEVLLKRALNSEFLSVDEGLLLYEKAQTSDLVFVANELRKQKTGNNNVFKR